MADVMAEQSERRDQTLTLDKSLRSAARFSSNPPNAPFFYRAVIAMRIPDIVIT
jgi:hypothetical protein